MSGFRFAVKFSMMMKPYGKGIQLMTNISPQNPVAYFCAEFGLDVRLPLYAGGLGVLAGDTMKAAADQNFPFVGVGLLYRGERAIQTIDETGMQIDKDMDFDPLSAGLEHVYIDDQPLFVKVHLTEIDVWARVWKKQLSENVALYLLDTDTDQNQLQERSITHGLYVGTEENQMKQQFILGIGGVKLLHELGIHPAVYHINEGRPAFLFWQLIRFYMDRNGMSYQEAVNEAKNKIVYTNHTLVAAGNNSVSSDLLGRYAQYYADKMGITLETLLNSDSDGNPERFSMTEFSLNSSRKASGVSELHSKLSSERWPKHNWTNVTNGVHMPTWQDQNISRTDLSSNELWDLHVRKKKELADFVKMQTGFGFDEQRLILSWSRRLAGYKRLKDLFSDIERLRSILKNEDRPVQLLVAGKAHVLDSGGKIMLQEVIKYMSKELNDNALFIPNYNLDIARYLVQGSDLWLNIPEFGKEACGTSGMKALSNGVLQCTVSDGWAHEVDWTGVGWTLESDNVAEKVYSKLENEIVPLFYKRDEKGIPQDWLEMMKKSVKLAERFSAKRMLDEYKEKMY